LSNEINVALPDIGDFKDVEIIEILVAPGDEIKKEDTLITLESDKATMDIPSPAAGIVKQLKVKVGDRVSQGSLILTLESATVQKAASASPPSTGGDKREGELTPPPTPLKGEEKSHVKSDLHAEVVVLGSGPGGYTAAFRSADLGRKTVLIERYATLGGVCLNVGCIPSKALLHIARVISEIEELKEHGIDLGNSSAGKKPVREFAANVVSRLTGGLKQMAKQRKVEVVQGTGRFTSPDTIEVKDGDSVKTVSFDNAIIAAGSQAAMIPGLPDDPRIQDSTSALLLENIPKRMLVIGGGIIGLEMATVYDALGTKITVVEMLDALIAGCDKDIVRPLQKRIAKRYENIYLKTSVTKVETAKNGLKVFFSGKDVPETDTFDAILVAVGRKPNGKNIGAENAGVNVDERGFIPVDDQMRTNVPHIFAIGDIAGQPMLAHKASHEGKVAAEVIAGHKTSFLNRVIPSVAYTDPEIAWVGLNETEAKAKGMDYGKGVFPWAASGRSLSLGRDDGITKILFDKSNNRIIGAAIVGPNAGDLIAECTLAIEMGADAQDMGLTVHPHPTLSETVGMAAEAFEGTITDLYMPKK
jgi:dihydrolipoamide dehydrogenase